MDEAFQSDYKTRGPRWAGGVVLPELTPGSRVLETGCGNGKTLSAFRDVTVLGIDISPEAVRLAGPEKAVCGDIRRLPFKDASFDSVFSWHVLGHLKKEGRMQAASELLRVTRPGGSVFFKGFSINDFRCGKGELVEDHSYLRGDGIMTHYFTEEELTGLFGKGEVSQHSWVMKVRGVTYIRSELIGVYLVR